MKTVAIDNEAGRLEALRQYHILDTAPEEAFDALARLAAHICQTPIAAINFIDGNRQWLKSNIGLSIQELPRHVGFCPLCIQKQDVLIIPDTWADEHLRANRVVKGYPYVRFYAGVPLIAPGGYAIGAICVVDYVAREVSAEQVEALQALSRQAIAQLELRRSSVAELKYSKNLGERVKESPREAYADNLELAPAVANGVRRKEASYMRTSEEIKAEIVEKFGFFPPFFSPALSNAQVLENLWQQTMSAYVGNPLSPLFKEKLSAYLSRYCAIPYCMICHSCSLLPLGMKPQQVLELLEAPPPTEAEIDKHLKVLAAQPDLSAYLPEPGSPVEESLLYCSIYITLEKEPAEYYRDQLRRLLGSVNYQHLITFIAYVKSCHVWMEAHPEVAYQADKRVIDYFAPLVEGEPGLAEFFRNYVEKVKQESQTWAEKMAAIAERKRHEEALRQSEEKFRNLVEQTNDWVWEIDTNGVFTYVSPQVRDILGYEIEEIIGKTTFDLMSANEVQRFAPIIGEFISKQEPFIRLEKTLIHKDGHLVVLETSGSPVNAFRGVLQGYRGIARDVTERKRTEAALRDSEQRFRFLTQAMPQQVWTAQPDGALDYFNQRVLDYFGRSFSEMLGSGWLSVLHPDDVPVCIERWSHSLSSGEVYEMEFRLQRKADETYRWHLARALPIMDEEGRIVSWFGTNTDIDDRKRAEEERDRFFTISLDMLCIANLDGYFTRLNPAWETTLGHSIEELLAQPFLNFVHPEDTAATLAEVEKLATGTPTIDFQNRYRCQDGSYKWLAWKAAPVAETGKLYCLARDITPNKLAEQERLQLLEREQAARAGADAARNRIENILESITDAFFALDYQWRFTYINQQAELLLQRTREELLGKSIWDEFPEAVGSTFEREYHRAVSQQVSVAFEELYPPLHKWFEVHGYPSKDGLAVYFSDVSSRRLAQEELQRQHRRSQLFAEISLKIRQSLQIEDILQTSVTEVQRILQADRVLIYRIWPDGNGKAIAEEVVPGLPSILGHNFSSEIIPEEYREMYAQGRIRAIEDLDNADVAPCLVEFVRQFNVKAKLVVPILLNEELWGLLIAHQCDKKREWSSFEIELLQQLANQIGIALAQAQLLEQETRQRQELIRSNEELQQFAYIASHDLQEPLRKIQAFGDRLKTKYKDSLNEQGRDYIERMQNAAGRMQVLINDLLALSRVTTKAKTCVPVNLASVAKEVVSDLEVRIQQTGGRVEVGELPTINAEPLQMRQLLQNLIGNALKFHRESEPPLVKIYSQLIKSQEQQAGDLHRVADIYQIFVEDNGIGFDEKYLDRIFSVFQRLHSRSEYEGSGMGLAICRKIVEHHGGSITAKSTPAQGATFIITLPI